MYVNCIDGGCEFIFVCGKIFMFVKLLWVWMEVGVFCFVFEVVVEWKVYDGWIGVYFFCINFSNVFVYRVLFICCINCSVCVFI